MNGIAIVGREVAYSGWTRLSVVSVRLGDGRVMRREIVEHGRAAAVLAYDPTRRTALLVRQFRVPVFIGSGETALLEAIAGMLDGEDAPDAARREALEEAGLRLADIERVGEVWTSPGMLTEKVTLYLARYRAEDRVAAGGGLAAEHEEIEIVELPLGELAAMADDGRLVDMKTLALVQTLRLREPALFAGSAP